MLSATWKLRISWKNIETAVPRRNTSVVLQLASVGYSAGLAASLEHQLEKYCPQCFVFWPGRPWQHWGAGEVSPHLTPAQVQPLSPSAFTDLTSSNRSVRFYSFYPTWEITSQECPVGSALHSIMAGNKEEQGTGVSFSYLNFSPRPVFC